MASKIKEYRAGAERCEQRAKKTRNQDDREWQLCLAMAYRILAEVESERSGLLAGKLETRPQPRAYAQARPVRRPLIEYRPDRLLASPRPGFLLRMGAGTV
jgi:hypothetical protein